MAQLNKLLPILSVLIVALACSGATWIAGPGKGTYAAVGGSTQLASDNFNRTDSADLGASWDVLTSENAFQIASNLVTASSGGGVDCAESNNSVSWPADQYSEVAMTATTSTTDGVGYGVLVRAATGARTYYRAIVSAEATNNVELGKFVANTYTTLQQITQAWTAGDVLRLEVAGTTLKIFRNGTQIGTNTTDSAIATGRAGINFSGSATGGSIDNWAGGSIP